MDDVLGVSLGPGTQPGDPHSRAELSSPMSAVTDSTLWRVTFSVVRWGCSGDVFVQEA